MANAITGVRAPRPRGGSGRLARLRTRLTGRNDGIGSDPEAYRLMVASLFSSPASLVVSNLTGALVLFYCWFVSGADAFRWLTLAATLVSLLRVATVLRYRCAAGPSSLKDVRRWDHEFSIGATALSITLGLGTFVALAGTDSLPCHVITIICGIAFSSGYVARNAGRPSFVIVQLLCCTIPMAAGFLLASDPFYEVIAVYIALYAVTNIFVVFSLHRNLVRLADATRQSQVLTDSLRHKNLTLDSALNSMTHGLCMLSRDLKVEIANSRFLQLYGLERDDVAPGTLLVDLADRITRAQTLTAATASDLVQLCRRSAEHAQTAEIEILTEAAQVFVVSVELAGGGGLLLLTEDASARKAAARQIERMARSDLLTELPNRFRFGEILAARLKRPESRLALFYVDLDDFKGVNDTLGHEAGDALLIEVANRLRQVGGQDLLVGRFGGDEFLVLADVADEAAALALGRSLLSSFSEPVRVGNALLQVTTSVGIALAPEHGTESSDLLRAADMALYAAKADGRNTAILYTHAIATALSHRRELEQDLREAARCGRLTLHYQPIVDSRTNVVRSYEALMRWRHPERGMVPPSDFIPIAEQIGLINQMGAWALRQACIDARSWPEGVSVAVNVSAAQFKEPAALIESVKDALLISGLEPGRLELEVTESLLIVDQDATLQAIRALRRIGVRFSLDDFGTGYSSLGYIARYPFSKVKIDRSFAEHLTSDSTSRSIIEVVCQLAVKLGMRVVVEGIETEEQRREIVALGAEQAQGWLFGRPQAADAIERARPPAKIAA